MCFCKQGYGHVTTSVIHHGRVTPPDVMNAAISLMSMRYGAQNAASCMAALVPSPSSSPTGPRVSQSNSPSTIPSKSPPEASSQAPQHYQNQQEKQSCCMFIKKKVALRLPEDIQRETEHCQGTQSTYEGRAQKNVPVSG